MRIWRWAAGRERPLPEGGKADPGRVGAGALEHQEGVGEHRQGEVAVQAVPAPALVVGQAALALGVLVELLDDPAAVRERDEPLERGIGREVAEVVLGVALLADGGALDQEPALGPSRDPGAGVARPAPGSAVEPQRGDPPAQGSGCAGAPGDGPPRRVGDRRGQLGGGVARRQRRLAGPAAAAVRRRGRRSGPEIGRASCRERV